MMVRENPHAESLMPAVEGSSVWFQTCLDYFSKQHKMRCIGLMGHVETKPEVARVLFPPPFLESSQLRAYSGFLSEAAQRWLVPKR